MLKLYFNSRAFAALATELRRASWDVAVAAAGSGWKLENFWVLFAGGVAWLILQTCALALESIKRNDEEVADDE